MNALLRLVVWMLAIVLMVLPAIAVVNGWIGAERWPMRHLSVTGEFQQVPDSLIREAVLPQTTNGFFAVDLNAVRDAVEALPWVDVVKVRKRWPDRLELTLTEHRPVAHWGEGRMLAESGQLFAPPQDAAQDALPRFYGPDDRAVELWDFYRMAQPQFEAQQRSIAEVHMSARGSWSLRLSDGLLIDIGRGDPSQRLARFVALLPKIPQTDQRHLLRADLRYTNGFSLTWQAQQTPPSPSAMQASS